MHIHVTNNPNFNFYQSSLWGIKISFLCAAHVKKNNYHLKKSTSISAQKIISVANSYQKNNFMTQSLWSPIQQLQSEFDPAKHVASPETVI